MSDGDTQQARRYHEQTKHSPLSVQKTRHTLDWDNKPQPFKTYPNLEPEELPEPGETTSTPGIQHIRNGPTSLTEREIQASMLSTICHYSAGVTREITRPDGTRYYFRAAACAGALYPTEFYLHLSSPISPEWDAGLYHFHPLHRSLTRLREGDWRAFLSKHVSRPESVRNSPVQVVLSSIPWRSSWKYRERAYRHLFWDSGTILSNLFSLSHAFGLRPTLCEGFVDPAINRFLGLDGKREFAIAVVPLESNHSLASPSGKMDCPPIDPEVLELSPDPQTYDWIQQTYRASVLPDQERLGDWSEIRPNGTPVSEPSGDLISPGAFESERVRKDTLETIIQRRGSSRAFRNESVELEELAMILQTAREEFPADFPPDQRPTLHELYMVASDVDGLTPGAYYVHPGGDFERLRAIGGNEIRRQAGHLCLDQRLGGEAAAVLFPMVDLDRVLSVWGNRGYRAAQHEAGVLLGKWNLLTYAQKLASTGLTFYDDEVTEFFSPHAEGLTPLVACAIGKEGNRSGLR